LYHFARCAIASDLDMFMPIPLAVFGKWRVCVLS